MRLDTKFNIGDTAYVIIEDNGEFKSILCDIYEIVFRQYSNGNRYLNYKTYSSEKNLIFDRRSNDVFKTEENALTKIKIRNEEIKKTIYDVGAQEMNTDELQKTERLYKLDLRVVDCLNSAKIFTDEELVNIPPLRLARIKNLGKVAAQHVANLQVEIAYSQKSSRYEVK